MEDILGYDREIKTNEVVSSDYATLDLGGGAVGLVQNAQWQYQHRVQPIHEAGSPAVYFVNGQPMGQLSVSRFIDEGGFLDQFKTAGSAAACGELQTLNVGLDGNGNCDISGGSSIKFRGAKLRGISGSYQAGSLQVSESADFIISTLTN